MNIVFDLDGTLIDSKLRLYNLFQHLVPVSELMYEEYWGFKKKKVSNQMILEAQFGYAHEKINSFVENWMVLIESEKYLTLDKKVSGVDEKLEQLNNIATLYICTDRQDKVATIKQLNQMSLLKYFKQVLVTQKKVSKELLLKGVLPKSDPNDWIIGDTGSDIQVGRNLGISTCAVCNGFLNRDVLLDYNPDLLVETIAEFEIEGIVR